MWYYFRTKGYRLVGADLSGLELRWLAHYMAKFDDGAYAKEVVEGDVHTANQKAAGLPSRNNAKTFIYGFLYGAEPAKLVQSSVAEAEGRKLINKFLNLHRSRNCAKQYQTQSKRMVIEGHRWARLTDTFRTCCIEHTAAVRWCCADESNRHPVRKPD